MSFSLALTLLVSYAVEHAPAPILNVLTVHPGTGDADILLRLVRERRRESAVIECRTRVGEYRRGLSTVNVALDSNLRLLHAMLDAGTQDARIKYESVAAEIESIAVSNFENGTGGIEDVRRATSFRVRNLLGRRDK